jgi:hypothetical protein
MRSDNIISSITIVFILTIAVLLCADGVSVRAQQSNAMNFNQGYETSLAKAQQECKLLWSDHAFDALRHRISLGEEKPSFAMLTNPERLRPKDKPVADLAKKTLEQCRLAYAPVYAMLPEQINAMVKGIERRQDALIAELYVGKITFGQFNVSMNRITREFLRALSGIPQTAQVSPSPADTAKTASKPVNLPNNAHEGEAKPIALPPSKVRIALVIGNSDYQNLPRLPNPVTDAQAISAILKQMGYVTQLVLNASEQDLRRNVRKFATDSSQSEVALVFYAGHGAQVNGENYFLPVDMDIPRTEADIQLTGLKVDDLVNSVRSTTKVVFLDACRDNPALFKHVVVGRGTHVVGLAPTVASNLEPARAGGGIFIAYATDSGSVALDGQGEHSPFTQALLRNLQKPISIDDMFSLVTREVRLVTKNAQRPYKYASLENIVCLTPACSSAPVPGTADILHQARQSEKDELQIAMQTKNETALETFLQKYPETTRQAEILSTIGALKRSDFKEWTLYEIGNLHNPQFLQLSSIQQFGDRVSVKTKILVDPSAPKNFLGKSLSDASYAEQLSVYDCTTPVMKVAEESIFNESGELLSHYKWADPQYVNLSTGVQLATGSVGFTARNIVCNEAIRTPLVSKAQIRAMRFNSLSTTNTGDGEILYELDKHRGAAGDHKELIVLIKNNADHNVKDFFPAGTSIPNPPNYRNEVDRMLIRCDENKFVITKTEFWNDSNELVQLRAFDPAIIQFSEFQELSPFAILQQIVCQKRYVGLGVRLAMDNGLVRITEVFEGSPAAKVGIKATDIITHIDRDPVNGMTLPQITQKVRGPSNTRVNLTILRDGENTPLEVEVAREAIEMLSRQEGH